MVLLYKNGELVCEFNNFSELFDSLPPMFAGDRIMLMHGRSVRIGDDVFFALCGEEMVVAA